MNSVQEKQEVPYLGEVEIFLLQDGKETIIGRQKNLIVNTGMDLLAKAAAGQIFINGMYIAYSNEGTPIGASSPLVTRTANYYQTTGSDATKGFMRVPLAAEASFSTSDVGTYNNNKVTFLSITDGNVAVPIGGNEITDGVSIVYGAALVYQDPNDMANDVLYSAITFTDLAGVIDEITVLAGAQIGVRWSQSFVQP
jgi:hypothetical protein